MKTTISRIKNLIRWFPVIWNDRDWDSEFTLDILLKKLEHQRDFFLSKDTRSMLVEVDLPLVVEVEKPRQA